MSSITDRCKIDGCVQKGRGKEGRYFVKGYCSKHYDMFSKHGDPLASSREYHGMNKTPVYRIWCGIRQRCCNPKYRAYSDYGGRGIELCESWRSSFMVFYLEMGDRPSPKHSIDRIDNSKGYELNNCRWAVPVEQANNTRSNRLIEFQGRTQSISLWCRELGLNYDRIYYRIHNGWPVDKALTTPKLR